MKFFNSLRSSTQILPQMPPRGSDNRAIPKKLVGGKGKDRRRKFMRKHTQIPLEEKSWWIIVGGRKSCELHFITSNGVEEIRNGFYLINKMEKLRQEEANDCGVGEIIQSGERQ